MPHKHFNLRTALLVNFASPPHPLVIFPLTNASIFKIVPRFVFFLCPHHPHVRDALNDFSGSGEAAGASINVPVCQTVQTLLLRLAHCMLSELISDLWMCRSFSRLKRSLSSRRNGFRTFHVLPRHPERRRSSTKPKTKPHPPDKSSRSVPRSLDDSSLRTQARHSSSRLSVLNCPLMYGNLRHWLALNKDMPLFFPHCKRKKLLTL